MENKNIKVFFAISFICLIYSFPLILWGGYYWDDVIRSLFGLYGWRGNGRPLADVVFSILNFGGINANIYPLPQLLAVMIMAFTIFICWKRFLSGKGDASLLCCIPLIAAPTFVENLSFRYDSLTMALSVMIACIPAIVETSNVKKVILTTTCVVAFLSLYQASITIFVILTILVFLDNARKGLSEVAIRSATASIVSLIIGYLVYTKFISSRYLEGAYNINHSKVLGFLSDDFFEVFRKNLDTFFTSVLTISPGMIFICILVPAVIAAVVCLYISYVNLKVGGKYGVAVSLMTLLCMPVLVFCIVGPVSLLQQPVFTPRVLMGYGAFIMTCNILTMWYSPKKAAYIFLVPFIYMTVFCYAYTNSLKSQDELEGAITRSIINDISALNSDHPLEIAISGRMPKSQQTVLAEKTYPIIHNLTPILVNNNSGWALQRFKQYGLSAKMASEGLIKEMEKDLCNQNRFRRGPYYDMYTSDKVMYIDFTKKCR